MIHYSEVIVFAISLACKACISIQFSHITFKKKIGMSLSRGGVADSAPTPETDRVKPVKQNVTHRQTEKRHTNDDDI